jgi:hypothetical protein
MSENIIGNCWNCGHDLTRLDYGREATCLACDKPTHCCLNCRHYAPGKPNECMEPLVDRIVEKARANSCELFEPSASMSAAGTPDREQLRAAAEDLFK